MDTHHLFPFKDLIGGFDADPSLSVARRLRAAISLGFVENGDMLPSEPLLAEQLGSTLFAVRAALATLRDEGFICTRRGRGGGSVITATDVLGESSICRRLHELSAADVRDIGDWRQILSGAEAMFAAERASAGNITRLRAYVHRMETVADPAGALSTYGRVHLELAAAAQSVRMMREELQFTSSYGWMCALALTPERARRQFVRTYTRVIDTLQSGDPRRARRLSETHASRITAAVLEAHLNQLRPERGGDRDPDPN